jgi:MOSC domain-containing protein YiiM
MNDPRFVKRFSAALRLGSYLRIVEPGAIARGDAVAVLARPAHGITVRDVARIYYREHHRRRELLAAPELGESWRAWAERDG